MEPGPCSVALSQLSDDGVHNNPSIKMFAVEASGILAVGAGGGGFSPMFFAAVSEEGLIYTYMMRKSSSQCACVHACVCLSVRLFFPICCFFFFLNHVRRHPAK